MVSIVEMTWSLLNFSYEKIEGINSHHQTLRSSARKKHASEVVKSTSQHAHFKMLSVEIRIMIS